METYHNRHAVVVGKAFQNNAATKYNKIKTAKEIGHLKRRVVTPENELLKDISFIMQKSF